MTSSFMFLGISPTSTTSLREPEDSQEQVTLGQCNSPKVSSEEVRLLLQHVYDPIVVLRETNGKLQGSSIQMELSPTENTTCYLCPNHKCFIQSPQLMDYSVRIGPLSVQLVDECNKRNIVSSHLTINC